MKVVTIIGARPQFIKSAPVSKELAYRGINEIIIHTGQHFDHDMNDIFFEQLAIPKPTYFLDINNLSHGAMTGRMIEKIESVLFIEEPDLVIVYGDTNSTLSGAIAAAKLQIKIVHIEAGLRSFNNRMPEEINRILTDRLSTYLFCPTDSAVQNLVDEGFTKFNCNIVKSGDVMMDAMKLFSPVSRKPKVSLPENFILCTIHREENTSDTSKLKSIFEALNIISEDANILLPVHPRTQKKIHDSKINKIISERIMIMNPVGYLEMLYLLEKCKLVFTDSGGLQKEAYFFDKLCLTLRDETEWVELVHNGSNYLCGVDSKKIIDYYNKYKNTKVIRKKNLFGNGDASIKIVKGLTN